MKIRLPLVPALAAIVLSGCGQKDSVAAASSAPAATPPTPAAAPAPAAAARVIEITASDQMKFSVARIEAKVGEELKVVLTNIGMMPKEAMGHNWVLLKAGTDVAGFATASMGARGTDFIAPEKKDQVLAFIPVLGPKKSGEVTFKAPAAGEYTFICSFPGHFAIMRGVLVVK